MNSDENKPKFSISNLLHRKGNAEEGSSSKKSPSDRGVTQGGSSSPLPPQPHFSSGTRNDSPPLPDSTQSSPPESVVPARNAPLSQPPLEQPSSEYGMDYQKEPEIDIYRYVAILSRRRYIILAACLAGLFLSLFSTLKKPEIYTTKTKLIYKPFRPSEVLGKTYSYEMWIDRENQIATFTELLHSREILERVASNLSLADSSQGTLGMIEVTRIEKSNILEVQVSNRNGQMAADVANELAQTVIDYDKEMNTRDLNRAIDNIEGQITKTGKDLKSKEEKLRDFQERNQFVQATEQTRLEVRKLSALELDLQSTALGLEETKRRLDKVEEELQKHKVDVRFSRKLTNLELELATSESRYGKQHPRTKETNQQIESVKNLIEAQAKAGSANFEDDSYRLGLMKDLTHYRTDYVALKTKRAALVRAIDRISSTMEALPAKELAQLRLMRNKQTLEDVYKLLNRKLEEAKIQRDSQPTSMEQIEKAVVPLVPIASGQARSLVIGLLIGVSIGIGIAFLLEYLDQSIKNPSDIEDQLRIPLIGAIPQSDTEQASLEHGIENENMMEPYRMIRTNLQYSLAGKQTKVFMVTSAMQGEGKSSKSSKLAVSFAMDSKKVLLIDADMRRASQHTIFQTIREPGLSEYLSGQKTLQESTRRTTFPNLSLMPAGARPPNPPELLSSATMDRLLEEARAIYDVIILDTPAALPVTDATVLAPKADGVIMIVQALKTPIKAAKHIKENVARLGVNILGCVLNRIPFGKGYYSYYYYYYPYYGYYYGYHENYEGPAQEIPASHAERAIRMVRNRALGIFRYKLPARGRKLALALGVGAVVASALFYGITRMALPVGRNADSIPASPSDSLPLRGSRIEDIVHPPPQFPLDSSALVSAIKANVRIWEEAFRGRDIPGFLALYRRTGLATPVGGFDSWSEYTRKQFQSRPNAKLTTKELRFLSIADGRIQTALQATVQYPRSKLTAEFRHTWVRSASTWLISQETYRRTTE